MSKAGPGTHKAPNIALHGGWQIGGFRFTVEEGRLIFDYRDSEIPFLERMFQKRNRYYQKLRDSVVLQN